MNRRSTRNPIIILLALAVLPWTTPSFGLNGSWPLWWLEAVVAIEAEAERPVTVDVVVDDALADGVEAWLELTPMGGTEPPTILRWRPGAETPDDAPPWQPPLGVLARGPAMVCAGATDAAVTCGTLYLASTVASVVRLSPGLEVTGRYLLAGQPVVDARVAVTLAGLDWSRPFLMPLGETAPGGVLGRAVRTDDDGFFALPALAAGHYRLETILPDGRVHHGEIFELPSVADARRQLGAFEEDAPVWALDAVDLREGLSIDFVVRDGADEPIVGATVFARQGDRPRDAVFFEARTDAEGRATLSGFDVDLPVHTGCRAMSHQDQYESYELLPVEVACTLVPLAGLTGTVVGADDVAPADTRIVVRRFVPRDAEAQENEPPEARDALGQVLSPFAAGREATVVDAGVADNPTSVAARLAEDDDRAVGAMLHDRGLEADGRFAVRDLAPGHYRVDVSAPGHANDAYEVRLDDSGTPFDLGLVRLLRGQRIDGVVVNGVDGEPVADAVVTWASPPGAESATTDGDGAFSLTAGAAGRWTLDVRHPDHPPATQIVDLPASADDPLRIVLEPGGQILAVVWDAETGTACAGCTLRVLPGDRELTTDAAGEALTDVMAPGRYRVERAATEHRGSTVIERPRAEVRMARVRAGGIVPVWFGERRRRVIVQPTPSIDPTWSLRVRGRGREARVLPEADGSFVVEVEAGERPTLYLERVGPTGHLDEILAAQIDDRLDTLDWTPPPTVLQATIRHQGAPAVGRTVQLLALDDRTRVARTGTDAEGRLVIEYAQPGVYALEIDGMPIRSVRLEAGRPVDLGPLDVLLSSEDIQSTETFETFIVRPRPEP